MSRQIPQPGDSSIPSAFLAELDRAAHLPIRGPGVVQTSHGTFINPPTQRVEEHRFHCAEVPPKYGCMAVTGVHTINASIPVRIPDTVKPTATIAADYLINGGEVVQAATLIGKFQNTPVVKVLYEGADPSSGDELGPVAGSWAMSAAGTPKIFTVYGVLDSTNKIAFGRVHPLGGLTPRILYDDVAPGDADKLAWPCKSDMTADTDADKVTVQNTHPGNFRGYGDSHTDYTATNAAKVLTYIDAAGDEQIAFGIGLAKTIIVANTASGHAAVAADTTSFTATFTRVCDDGQVPTASSPATLVVYNPGFEIDDNLTDIVCVLDTGTGVGNCLYRIIDADCPA